MGKKIPGWQKVGRTSLRLIGQSRDVKQGRGRRGQSEVQGQQILSALGGGCFRSQPQPGCMHGGDVGAGDN